MPNTREKLMRFSGGDVTPVVQRTVQEWISVKDRLPEDDGKVLAIVKEDGYNRIAFVFYESRRWWDCFYDGFRNINVTHWMPLPEPPEGE